MTVIRYSLTLDGIPRTKKNSARILRFGKFNKVVPSKAYLEWRDAVLPQMQRQWQRGGIAWPVNVRATVYRDALRGDLLGYLDGIADAMQEAGVVADDKWILGWDGSRLDKDAAAPRVELVIGPLAAYREDAVEGTVY